MRFLGVVSLSLTLLSSVLAGSIQKPGLVLPDSAPEHLAAAKQIFTTSYEAYREFAFGHDNLQPVDQTFNDERNGWGASIVDAMSTMVIMGLDDDFEEALEFAQNIDFSDSQSDMTVSVFETTIRYLGGLLSAYELSGEKHDFLIQKAQILGDKLAVAFNGDSAISYGFLNFSTDSVIQDTSNIAEAGTLVLEWGTLSKHTQNDTYLDLTLNALRHIAELPPPLPGLAAQGIDPATGEFVGGYVTWGGGSDSYFEYLIKWSKLSNTDDQFFADTWRTAVETSIEVLARRSTVGDWLYLADFDSNRTIRHLGSHLECFHAGNWMMGGKLMDDDSLVDFALELNEACWNTYASTATGIGPDGFAYKSFDGGYTGGAAPTEAQEEFFEEHGFYPRTGREYYYLRPEVLESNFYAWRVTGDTKYLDRAAAAIDSINEFLPSTVGFAGIEDVDVAGSEQINNMESFWFAEVLKYLYLIFDDPSHISLDEWVFNTEAHPFKAPTPKDTYGTGTIYDPGSSADFRLDENPPAPPAISPAPFIPPVTNEDQ